MFAAVGSALASNSGGRWDRRIVGESEPASALAQFGLVSLLHVGEHAGEIAALKGVAGLKGLPF